LSRIRVLSYGLGPIGQRAARLVLGKRRLELAGAVDVAPELAGGDLGEVLGDARAAGVPIAPDLDSALRRAPFDAALHCTSSFLPEIAEQLIALARAGIDVVSSSEELLLPDLQHPQLSARIAGAAAAGGATIVGTGVNPGYVMDFAAVVASAVCADVRAVRCVRVVDAATRRLPLQRKVGAGLSPAEFEARRQGGRFGHIGMRESVALLARALELELVAIEQTLEPVLATEARVTPHLTVPQGSVAGIHNVGRGLGSRGEPVIELDLSMYVGAREPRDEVHLQGSPDVHLCFLGGVAGDEATAAVLVNTLPQVVAAAPGLLTVLDLPPPRLVR
jgi:4-hydroxy-tetrahydrodipicolinate reductase